MNVLPHPFAIESPSTHYNRHEGDQWVFYFPNGYGASVIRTSYSYGHEQGLYELAVLKGIPGAPDVQWSLTYETPITDDVLEFLNADDVSTLLHQICRL